MSEKSKSLVACEPTHSRFPPSSASRWTRCTASIGFIEANADVLPKDTSSVYADEGTEAHAQAAAILTGKQRLIQSNKADMLIHVRAYIEFVQGLIQPGERLLVEHRVRLFYLPEQKGTLDAAIIGPKRIYIPDLKYGAGVSVYAKENEQLASYAESLIRELEIIEEVGDDTLVTLAIFQPRDRSDSNPIRLWALSRAELRRFVAPIEQAKERILKGRVDKEGRILSGDIEFKPDPDKQCRFCPAAGICTARANHGLTVVSPGGVDAPIVLPDPGKLTREQRQKILAVKSDLVSFLEAVEDQEVHELMQGAAPLAFKLVAGKSNRVWQDEEAAEKLLRNHLTAEQVRPPGKLVSVKQAEDALKGIELSTKFQNRFAELVVKPPGNPSLVPVTDKRLALEFNPTADLEAQPASPADVI